VLTVTRPLGHDVGAIASPAALAVLQSLTRRSPDAHGVDPSRHVQSPYDVTQHVHGTPSDAGASSQCPVFVIPESASRYEQSHCIEPMSVHVHVTRW
jgi:hypothetical protein